MKKTDLEVFVEMNQNDVKNSTQTLGICYSFAGMQKVKGGGNYFNGNAF